MSLSDQERAVLSGAGTAPDPVFRRQAVAIALRQSGTALTDARDLLATGFTAATQPSFQYIPRGDSMASEAIFDTAYVALAAHTDNFRDVNSQSLVSALTSNPATLAPLRMILGLTHNELAWSMKQVRPASKTSGGTLKNFERHPTQPSDARTEMIETIVGGVRRQVQDAYSEVKGDRLLEQPIADLLEANDIDSLRGTAS